jgi:hypothetical protein
MKGVNWSKSRKVLGAITVCLGITIMVYRGLIWLNCTIVTTILAAKVLPLQVFSVPNQHY